MKKISILNSRQIEQKVKRMAYEIWEHNYDEKEVVLLGVAPTGYILAKELGRHLQAMCRIKTQIISIEVHKTEPEKDTDLCVDTNLNNKSVILVDDVANSGKTLLYALRPVLRQLPSKIEIAVLVNRHHKNFPVVPGIIGHAVSTTLQDHIEVSSENGMLTGATLS